MSEQPETAASPPPLSPQANGQATVQLTAVAQTKEPKQARRSRIVRLWRWYWRKRWYTIPSTVTSAVAIELVKVAVVPTTICISALDHVGLGRCPVLSEAGVLLDSLERAVKSNDRLSMLGRLDQLMIKKPRLVDEAREGIASFIRDSAQRSSKQGACLGSRIPSPELQKAAHVFFAVRNPKHPPPNILRLDGTDLRGISQQEADLRRVSLAHACLRGDTFALARLDNASFADARMDSVVMEGSWGDNVDFEAARLYGANLNGVTLSNSSFQSARLQCALLAGASLTHVDFQLARISWAFFDRAVLVDAQNWRDIPQESDSGTYLRTARLDTALRAWSARHGADTTTASVVDWTKLKERQWQAGGSCARSASVIEHPAVR